MDDKVSIVADSAYGSVVESIHMARFREMGIDSVKRHALALVRGDGSGEYDWDLRSGAVSSIVDSGGNCWDRHMGWVLGISGGSGVLWEVDYDEERDIEFVGVFTKDYINNCALTSVYETCFLVEVDKQYFKSESLVTAGRVVRFANNRARVFRSQMSAITILY